MRSFGHPPLTNQVIYFLGTDDLGHLFSSTRLFEMKPFVSLSNVNLQETKIQDIILDTPDLFCANVEGAYFSNVRLKNPIFHYADLSKSNLVNTTFKDAQFYWSNLENVSIELNVYYSHMILSLKKVG